jgi:transcriptional regulator with XRE-family HTH domain
MIPCMPTGAEQLSEWMRRAKMNQAEAARYLGFDAPYVSVLLSGKRTPGLDNAILLERLTGIPVEAWASSELDDQDAQVSAGRAKPQVNK